MRISRALVVVLLALIAGCDPQPKSKTNSRPDPGESLPMNTSNNLNEAGPEKNRELTTMLNQFFNAQMGSSFHISYENSLFQVPTVAGGLERRIVIVDKGESYYSDTTRSGWSSVVYLKGSILRWRYWDKQWGEYLFSSDVNLNATSYETWLEDHDFVNNTFADFERDLFRLIKRLVVGATVLSSSNVGSERTFVLATTQREKLTLNIDPTKGRLTIKQRAEEGEKTLLVLFKTNGRYMDKDDPRTTILSRFSDAQKADVHILKKGFNMSSVLQECVMEKQKAREVSLEEARSYAAKFQLLFPTNNANLIKKAITGYGQLSLEIRKDGKEFTISQVSPGSRFEISENFIVQARMFQGYKVMELKEFANWHTYYVKENAVLMVHGPNLFNNRVLNEIILSFERLK